MKYNILLNGEFFSEFNSNLCDEKEVLERFFLVNSVEIECFETVNNKITAYTWQGGYTVE